MANHLGREGTVKISSTTIGELRNYSLAHSSDVVEDSVIGDIYRTRKATMKTWSVSGDLFWDETDAGQIALTIGSSAAVKRTAMTSMRMIVKRLRTRRMTPMISSTRAIVRNGRSISTREAGPVGV